MLESIKKIMESEFNLQEINNTLKQCIKVENYHCIKNNTDVFEIQKLIQCNCKHFDEKINKLILVMLYFENYRKNGQNNLHNTLKIFLDKKLYPCLHYENNTEEIILSELCLFLNQTIKEKEMVVGILEKDNIDFILNQYIVSNSIAIYVYFEADKYIKTADIATSLNLEAIRGEMGAFDSRLHEIARPFKGQIESAENIRRILEGSQMTTDEGRYAFGYDTHPRVQDAISLRATPQTHGGVRDMHYWLGQNIEKELTTSECGVNPIIEYSLNIMCTALCDLGNICERRTFRLNDTKMSYGLPMNLVLNAGFNHGYPVVQSTQAGVLAELKLLSLPSAAVKNNNECLSYFAGIKAMSALSFISKLLAVEILMSAQAMDIVQRKIPAFSFGKGSQAAFNSLREYIDVLDENRFIAPDMIKSDKLVCEGIILKAVESTIGKLK